MVGMVRQPTAIPLRPDYGVAARSRGADSFTRACAAACLSLFEPGDIGRIITRNWPRDEAIPILLRGAVSPANMTTSASAGILAQTALADFISTLGPASAGAAILGRGIQLSFDRAGAIIVPGLASAAANASFVQEGAAIPVRQLATSSSATLAPRKFGTICVFDREIFEHSVPNIETLVRQVLAESVGLALDTALLDATIGDATRPPGIRYNINATAESANADLFEAMIEDLTALLSAVAATAGNNPILIVTSPVQARKLRMRMLGRALDFEVFGSSAVDDGTVIAIASNGLISAIAPTPRIDASIEATLHMDTAPGPISNGTSGDINYPTRNLLQTDTVALKVTFSVGWGLRAAGAVAWCEDAIW